MWGTIIWGLRERGLEYIGTSVLGGFEYWRIWELWDCGIGRWGGEENGGLRVWGDHF